MGCDTVTLALGHAADTATSGASQKLVGLDTGIFLLDRAPAPGQWS